MLTICKRGSVHPNNVYGKPCTLVDFVRTITWTCWTNDNLRQSLVIKFPALKDQNDAEFASWCTTVNQQHGTMQLMDIVIWTATIRPLPPK